MNGAEEDRPFSARGFLLKLVAVLIYALLVLLLAQPFAGWFSLWKSPGEKGLSAAVDYDGSNSHYYYLLGRYYGLNMRAPDMEKAAGYYRKAVSLSPLLAQAWAGLSEMYQMSGNKREAEYSLDRAVRLDPTDPSLMWKAATFWLIEGSTDKAVETLRKYILIEPDRQREVYDLCRKLGIDNHYLLDKLVPGAYKYRRDYIEYLMGVGSIDDARDVWRIIDRRSMDKGLFLDYEDFLIRNRLYGEAEKIWHDIMPRLVGADRVPSLVWNPGFEHEIMNGGFDWVVREGEGADVFIDDSVRMMGSKSLGVEFDGRHNPGITIARQIVVVSPGASYTLGGYIKTESLTTDNGIFLDVEGYKCSPMRERSRTVTGTSFWTKVTVNFKVPNNCEAVVIGIRRERSKFDNKISGSAWIDGITLRQRADTLQTVSTGH